jgi:hypothetical protein
MYIPIKAMYMMRVMMKIDVGASKIQAAIMIDGLQRVCPPNPFCG